MRHDLQATADERLKASVTRDADLATLANATPAQINAWVDNVIDTAPNTVAGLKAILRRALKVLFRIAIFQLRRM
jgi:hypothetical protein